MKSSVPDYEKTGVIVTRAGARLPSSAPNSLYTTRDGKFIHIAALADTVYRRLVTAMKMPHLADDPRFVEQNVRSENVDAIDKIVSEWTGSHDLEEIEHILETAGVPASRIFTMADIFQNPHFHARDMLLDVPDDDLGPSSLPAWSEAVGNAWKHCLVGSTGRARTPARY